MTDDWSVLRLEVAGLASIEAIVIAVLHQADVVLALAQAAIPGAPAVGLRLFALHANVFLGHAGKLYRGIRKLAIGRPSGPGATASAVFSGKRQRLHSSRRTHIRAVRRAR